jgi:hypothetical protein
MSTQNEWHICFRCNSIFFAGGTTQGACATGGAHESRAFNLPAISLAIDIQEPATAAQLKKLQGKIVKSESGWRRCRKCECLFHAGFGSKGICPADNDDHMADTHVEYQIAFKGLANPKSADVKMRKCKKCLGMFWDSNWMAGVKTPDHAGRCPAKPERDFPSGMNRAHNGSGSRAYAISHVSESSADNIQAT